MKNLSIRPLTWASAASRRLLSSSPAAALEPSPSTAEIAEKRSLAEVEEDKNKHKKDFVPAVRCPPARVLAAAGGEACSKTMNQWVREGRPTKAIELVKFVKDLRKYRRYKHALELMDWMVKIKGMNLSYTNHAIRIDLMSKVKGIESAEDYFSKLPENAKQEQTYGALFSCYCTEKMLDKALSLYKKMKELGFASNNLLHNNLMGLYMKLEQPEKVPIILKEMKANNLVPDNVTYCIVMNSYAALNDIDSVERVIQEMEDDENSVIQWNAYSTLASIYISAGHFEKAESALKKLEGLIDSRERLPFHFLISLYASTGNLEEINRVWKSLKATFVKCTNMSYLTMLQALNKLDDIEGMKQIYEEWELIHETYDSRLTNVLISCYLRNDMIEEADSLYMKTKDKQGKLDFRTCELFMDYYLKKNETGSAMEWLEIASRMAEDGEWKLNLEKVSLFLQHYEKEKDADGIEKFCKILKKLNCLGSGAYKSLIHIYAATDKKDPSLCKWIKEEKIELDPETQKLLDKACASK
ncbi:uncharacterized protein A4U43_C07F12570 [Asparagus officinalis]|uniref:Pentacotripeptide-repeat region of PRORP domain-containing protein n=1 Tax=Asparagus officinalis TaxID=4686 RepID=A0A5P1EBM2_ASPOF|nr:pentatricopeptide repeat-containing protein At4g01990, mitochondrial-like [Asparagus officinalis]ONK63214.1 uncharacterized protein A4U43_C07F12570 [Asparagus officinalis]